MNSAARFFIEYLEQKDVKYTINGENRVRVGFSGENATSISTLFVFGADGTNVAVRSYSIAKVPEEKIAEACILCSSLNSRFRWTRFYIDSDNEVTAAIDAVIDPHTTGAECFELLIRIVDIIDDAYPEIMKMLWS